MLLAPAPPNGRSPAAPAVLLLSGLMLLALPLVLPAWGGLSTALLAALGSLPGLDAAALWPEARVQGLLVRGLLLALLSGLLATAVGAWMSLALLLPLRPAWRVALAAALAASFCFGTVVHLLAWRVLFPGVTGGADGWAMAVLTLGLRYAPLAVALFAVGLATFERAELETALCTGGARALWAIARRRLSMLAGMALAAVAALVFCESELPALVGLQVFAEEYLSRVALEPSADAATALGWPLMAMALACAALLSRLPRLSPAAAGAVSHGWIGQWPRPPRWLDALVPTTSLVVAALPLLLLLAGSVMASGRWPAHAGAALVSSLWVAAMASALACAWAWALAATAWQAGPVAVAALNVLLWLMMLWPSALIGLALAGWAAPPGFGGAVKLVLAHALRVLPFAAWVLLAVEGARPRAPQEQLRVLGAAGWTAWRSVSLPAAWPGLAAAFVLAAGLSLAELTATVLTVPPGMETVILRLYNLLHYGDQRGVMLLALVQGLTVALGMASALALWGRSHART